MRKVAGNGADIFASVMNVIDVPIAAPFAAASAIDPIMPNIFNVMDN